jgi:hypothetical protein
LFGVPVSDPVHPMHKLPHVCKSRHGIWYIRCQEDGKESRISLRTKDWHRAKVLALKFNLAWAMGIKKFDVIFPSGLQVTGINTDSDLERLLRMAEAKVFQAHLEARGPTPQPPTQGAYLGNTSALRAPAPLQQKSNLFSEVVALYLAEKSLGNGNEQKTIKEKQSVYDEVIGFFGDKDINLYTAEVAVSYKNRLIGKEISPLRINKKLSFLTDLFNYATNNHLFFENNSFKGLAIKLKDKPKSYQEFTNQELKKIFESPDYKKFMNKPDYLYLPYLSLFTGARIEELGMV